MSLFDPDIGSVLECFYGDVVSFGVYAPEAGLSLGVKSQKLRETKNAAVLLIAAGQWSGKGPASRRDITRIAPASIVEGTVPIASPSPAAPGNVIAILAVRISCFPGRAKDALSRALAGGQMLGH